MKCKIISISHKPADWESKALEYYLKQIPNNLKLSFVAVKPTASKAIPREDTIRHESADILSHIDQSACVILWDRRGDLISSTSLAKLFQDKMNLSENINMIIGGAYGVSDELAEKVDLILSASHLTFPHRLFKILLMEQIYRASAINRNHPYHK
ncbi:23S rRNA (pseudouridine(1915)-N(3))-methyltransferase RlmH [Gammaproteobacteria bacterium]|jgi:23S rRNA (pseudouridine1915-N3)-methyltransferase|nr:23S rRNA (pseudouridine(1915)-N(3))-methyltransferase RlmH [Gammaproteobacteria bacterium]|tara:strand:+ start:1674 stop:2138 length:465 start_codon:yes stop_codon:yes gene_type:complete